MNVAFPAISFLNLDAMRRGKMWPARSGLAGRIAAPSTKMPR
jgi:hypothetical protein